MPRKLRGKRQAPSRRPSRNEIILYVIGVIVALTMIFGTILSAVGS